jgi:hypothetical protein
MTDPKEFREHAERCIQMGAATTDRRVQLELLERAKTWLLLAHQFEKSQGIQGGPLGEATRAKMH